MLVMCPLIRSSAEMEVKSWSQQGSSAVANPQVYVAVHGALKLTDRGSAQCMVARDEWFGRLPVRKTIMSSLPLQTMSNERQPQSARV